MTDPYRTYLRAELSKLRNDGDARAFLDSGDCHLDRLGLPLSIRDLTLLFDSQPSVDAFVDGLSNPDAIYLTDCCARWRRNGVAGMLRAGAGAALATVPIDRILVRSTERSVEHIFQRHSYRLTAIAVDPELLSTAPYSGYAKGKVVDVPVCIAQPEARADGWYRLIDGVHRAIQLAINDEPGVSLLVLS